MGFECADANIAEIDLSCFDVVYLDACTLSFRSRCFPHFDLTVSRKRRSRSICSHMSGVLTSRFEVKLLTRKSLSDWSVQRA